MQRSNISSSISPDDPLLERQVPGEHPTAHMTYTKQLIDQWSKIKEDMNNT